MASKLGPNSRFFLELAAWAPITSYLFDVTATQCLILGAPDTPPEVRKAFAGVTDALLEILDAALRRLHFHSLRANQGAQFADAFQTQISLEGQHSTYLPPDVLDFDRRLAKKVVVAHQKVVAL